MSKKTKKAMSMLLVVALIAVIAIGGMLAYLTSDDSDVNVMTLGEVDIVQHEHDAAGNKVTDGKFGDLYPGTEVVKKVTVENTGKSDCYFRTLIAFEDIDSETFGINFPISEGYKWSWGAPEATIEIEGVTYQVYEAVYKSALPAGSTSPESLTKVELSKNSTNEDMEALGGTYEILVLSQAVQTAGFDSAAAALDEAFGDVDNAKATAWFKEVLNKHAVDVWDGTADISWYEANPDATQYDLDTAEEVAGLAKLVDEGTDFTGKTITLDKNIDLYAEDENGEPIPFDPIGSYRKDKSFKGIFDGQGFTISNLSQNTWALDNGYYYTDCGLGLFGAVEEGTVKNLVIDGAEISGESALCGTVAAVAHNATFENITVKNANVADYQYYAGGIVGWASGETEFVGCNVDASTTVGAQWGEFNNANGGVIGGVSTKDTKILMKDCTVACRIDGYNDVTSAYEWYSYRRSGMLIGDTGQKDDPDGDNVGDAIAPNLTCENVTVIYGDWANYHYCQFTNMGYPWVRVEEGISNSAYSNPRYGHPTDYNGNEVVDDNHVHADGEKHNELIVFDQLYGGYTGARECTYGTATHDGVKVIYNNK